MFDLQHDRFWVWAGRAVLAAALGLVMATFRDYGISWDEPLQGVYGEHVLRFWLSGFEDRRALETLNMNYYGGAYDALARLAVALSPFETFDTRHLLTALTGLIGVIGAGKLARHLGGGLAEFLAILLLLTTPSWWGHMFINPKDLPFAAAGIWTLYYIARLGANLPDPPLHLFVKFAVALGLTLSVRVGGVVFAFYGAVLLGLWLAGGGRLAGRTWLRLALAGTGAYAIMIALWPAALMDPIGAPMAAVLQSAKFSAFTHPITVLFQGEVLDSRALPWTYAPVYLAVKLPLLLGVAGVLGLGYVAWRLIRDRRDPGAVFGLGAVLLGAVFPVVYAMASNMVLYDAIRHLLFVVPPLVVAAALVLAKLMQVRAKAVAVLIAIGMGVGVVWPVTDMVRLHPYEYVYYNEAIGSVSGAEGQFELDYWVTSYRAAAEQLGTRTSSPKRVRVCGPDSSVYYSLPEGYTLARDGEDADYRIRLAGHECDPAQGEVLLQIKRMGTVLSQVEILK